MEKWLWHPKVRFPWFGPKIHQFDLVFCKVSCKMTKWCKLIKIYENSIPARENIFCETYFRWKNIFHIEVLLFYILKILGGNECERHLKKTQKCWFSWKKQNLWKFHEISQNSLNYHFFGQKSTFAAPAQKPL